MANDFSFFFAFEVICGNWKHHYFVYKKINDNL